MLIKPEPIFEVLNRLGFNISGNLLDKICLYFQQILVHYQKFDLLAPSQANQNGLQKFFSDSIGVFKVIEFRPGAKVADVGSGAGFPGIPVAIVRPDLKVSLIESRHKKVVFLKEVIKQCGLENVSVLETRAEDFRQSASDGLFDIALFKAFGKLKKIASISARILKPKALAVAYKSRSVQKEIEDLENSPVEGIKIKKTVLLKKEDGQLATKFVILERT